MGLPAEEKVIEKYAEVSTNIANGNEELESKLGAAVVTAKAVLEGKEASLYGEDLTNLASSYLMLVSLLSEVSKLQGIANLAAIPATESV